jgi:hypothetical protein
VRSAGKARASRTMAASPCRASILRDAVLRTAPLDEVYLFTSLKTGYVRP